MEKVPHAAEESYLQLNKATWLEYDGKRASISTTRMLVSSDSDSERDDSTNTTSSPRPLEYAESASSASSKNQPSTYGQTFSHTHKVQSLRKSLLIASAHKDTTRMYGIFGGQGTADILTDLRRLFNTYQPFLESFVAQATLSLQSCASTRPFSSILEEGIDVLNWVTSSGDQPNSAYLTQAPVSFPLVGLLQLANYRVAAHLAGCSPLEFATSFRGFAGHSQGVLVAVVASIATNQESFDHLSLDALEVLLVIGCRSQLATLPDPMPWDILKDAQDNSDGHPTCMLSVKGLDLHDLHTLVRQVNTSLSDGGKVEVALINGPRRFVVAGSPQSLQSLNRCIRLIRADGTSEARVPFSRRRPDVTTSYLPVSAPFHTSHMHVACDSVLEDVQHLSFSSEDLRIPVYDTFTGNAFESDQQQNLLPRLIRMIMTQRLDWPKVIEKLHSTHMVDFGPGKANECIGAMTQKLKDGSGVRTILFGRDIVSANMDIGSQNELFDVSKITTGTNWAKEYRPRISYSAAGGKVLHTRLSELLDAPPVLVGGMTPTTSSAEFVSAIINAGYHVELACGGFHSPDAMETAIRSILTDIPAGRGITCNVIYASPRAFKWQMALIKKLKSSGTPIVGLTIGAGVPSTENASGYVKELGLSHITFKPGNIEAIERVIEVAKADPGFPIILQWTGGRGGGHHSYEDFHDPILKTYARIRRCKNIYLIAGSGFGDAEGSYPYLSGRWSVSHGLAQMPFDGIMVASRVMVAKEAKTSTAAKKLIQEAPGVEDGCWEESYARPAGGIITVTSEMGEPIHKIATRGVQFWAELDRTIFSITDPEKRLHAVQKKRNYIISKLNLDSQKVWFGQTGSGEAAELEDMTYAEVTARLLQLTYLMHAKRWLDPSYKTLMQSWLSHVEVCLGRTPASVLPAMCEEHQTLCDLEQTVQALFPQASDQLISFKDQRKFIDMCRKPGIKPVPFITTLDKQFEYHFKKDSLWQSEDVEAVVDQDIGRVCILHGPVAARYSQEIDDPVKDILDGIVQGLVAMHQDNPSSETARVGDISAGVNLTSEQASLPPEVEVIAANEALQNTHASELWYERLSGAPAWRKIAFSSSKIYREGLLCDNPIREAFRPYHDYVVEVQPGHITLYGDSANKLAELRRTNDTSMSLHICAPIAASGNEVSLAFEFSFQPNVLIPMRDTTPDRIARVKDFYHQIWFGERNRENHTTGSLKDICFMDTFRLKKQDMQRFSVAISENRATSLSFVSPLDYAIVAAWSVLLKPLFVLDGDLLNLVHLSNEVRVTGEKLNENDVLTTSSHVTKVCNQDAGTAVEVVADIFRDGHVVATVVSQFLFRDYFIAVKQTFEIKTYSAANISLSQPKDVAILQSKPWFAPSDPTLDLLGMDLQFSFKTTKTFSPQPKLVTHGQVVGKSAASEEYKKVATIDWTYKGTRDLVKSYVARHSDLGISRKMFDDSININFEEAAILAPLSNDTYAQASHDLNPIHISTSVARLSGLPGCITHGMQICARVRNILERRTCGQNHHLFRSFQVAFVNMVLPGDELQVATKHIGMVDGCKIYHVEAKSLRTSLIVLEGEAQINNASTAILFTGQGSQRQGMGLAFRDSSSVARELWDRADTFFRQTYGFAISDVVKDNPKTLRVNFGGAKGRKIKENYIALTYRKPGVPIETPPSPLFPEIQKSTTSHSFAAVDGLLSATQFTQPALMIMEIAAYADMESRGVIPSEATFAGHSLGEYAAILANSKMMTLEDLMSVVFYRGLVMQNAVERDSAGRSPYGMCAINPSRVSLPLPQATLEYLVSLISKQTSKLIEIVNYNVRDTQYVCAGDKLALQVLAITLNTLSTQDSGSTDLTPVVEAATAKVLDVNSNAYTAVQTRGIATIPLTGIDVPFHSSFLSSGVTAFREFLYTKLDSGGMDPQRLIGRYVPNLTAKPFECSKSYVQEVFELTGSTVLEGILRQGLV